MDPQQTSSDVNPMKRLRLGASVFDVSGEVIGTLSRITPNEATFSRGERREVTFSVSDIVQVGEDGSVHLNEAFTEWLANADSVQPRLEAYGTDSGTVIHIARYFDPDLE